MDSPQQDTNVYEEKLRYYQEEIDQILKQEKAMAELTAKDPEGSMYKKIILESKTVFVNGPMGIFEESATEAGTNSRFLFK